MTASLLAVSSLPIERRRFEETCLSPSWEADGSEKAHSHGFRRAANRRTALMNEHVFDLRRAEPGDAQKIVDCLASAFEPFKHAYSVHAYEETVPNLERMHVRIGQMIVLVGVDQRRSVVGTLSGIALDNREGHLRGMATLPPWQGSSLAGLLLRSMEQELATRGCERVTLDTTAPLVRAARFYLKNGYQRTGRVSDFYGMPLFEFEKELAKRAPA
jgi:GNAT superfamily N-acetyltransferase